MKMKCTALLLTAIMCMAGAVSCGTVDNVGETSAELKIAATTASTDVTTTAAETGTTTTGESAETETTASAEAATEADTTAASAAPADTAAANNTPAANTEAPAQQQEQPQNNDNAQNNTPAEPEKKVIQFSIDDLLKNGADTVAALGNPDSTSISAACTNNGCDIKEYKYPDLEMQCYIDGGTEYICYIKIKGGDYTTSKGIKVGSSRADVEGVYGAGQEASGMVIYAEGEKEMDITYNGDTVASIEFYIPV